MGNVYDVIFYYLQGGVVKKAVHIPTHRFVALKSMTVFEREKRAQLIAEMKLLCEHQGGHQPGLVQFVGAGVLLNGAPRPRERTERAT